MISLCTVCLKIHYQYYLPILLESIVDCELINEIIICKNEEEESYREEFDYFGKKIKVYGCGFDKSITEGQNPNPPFNVVKFDLWRGDLNHALSLHQCIDKATNDYVFLCDPDVFFCNRIDLFYMDLIKKYNLNIIGGPFPNANNPLALGRADGNFPCVIHCLVKKSDLPPKSWLNGLLKFHEVEFPEKYLMPVTNLHTNLIAKLQWRNTIGLSSMPLGHRIKMELVIFFTRRWTLVS